MPINKDRLIEIALDINDKLDDKESHVMDLFVCLIETLEDGYLVTSTDKDMQKFMLQMFINCEIELYEDLLAIAGQSSGSLENFTEVLYDRYKFAMNKLQEDVGAVTLESMFPEIDERVH